MREKDSLVLKVSEFCYNTGVNLHVQLHILALHAATALACCAYAASMTSVCPYVTLLDCDHILQQKVEMGTRQDRSVSWLYQHDEAGS